MLTNNLIRIYDHVCNKYKEQIQWEVQKFSNNAQPKSIITDEELITIYLFCVAYEEKYKIKSMHTHIKKYWHSWFPLLPSYQFVSISTSVKYFVRNEFHYLGEDVFALIHKY